MTAPDRRACPYVGLEPFRESDHELFKGREREQRIIIANLLSAPLTILYGAAGVGKSSLLLAGVLPQLRAERPRTPVIVFHDWAGPHFQQRLVHACIEDTWRRGTNQPKPADTLPLDEVLRACSEAVHGTVLLILDQFEEYLLHHPKTTDAGSFEAQLARAVNRDDVDVGFLISVREASLSKLDRFRERIPNLLGNMLRLQHLDAAGAKAAIGQPMLDVWNRKYSADRPVTIEDALVDEVIDQVRAGLSFTQRGGHGVAEAEVAKIEAPFLQLVMARLWEEEIETSRVLRLATLQRLGGARQIVCAHLDDVMTQLDADGRAVCASFFDRLVTPTGSKVPCSTSDLAQWAGSRAARVPAILELLSARRILCTVESAPEHPEDVRYEIFHDVLAPAILEWHERYVEDQRQMQAVAKERERARSLRRWLSWLAISCAIVAFACVLAVREWLRATEALANQKAAQSMAVANVDSDRALDLALASAAPRLPGPKWLPHAWLERKLGVTATAENALRVALHASRLEWKKRSARQQIMSVALHPGGTLLAVGSRNRGDSVSSVEIWDTAARPLSTSHSRRFDASVGALAFLPATDQDSDRVIGTLGSSAFSWKLSGNEPMREFQQRSPINTALAVSADGTRFATAGAKHEGDEHRATSIRQRSIKIWNAQADAEPLVIDVGGAWVLGLAFSPDGCCLASAAVEREALDTYAAIWSASSGKRILDLPIQSPSDAVAFDPAGKFLVVGGRDGLAYILRPQETQLDTMLRRRAADGGSGNVRWNLTPLSRHQERIRDVAVSSDGGRIATAGGDKKIKIWDAASGENLRTLVGHTSYVESVAFSPDGHHLVSGARDGWVRMWNLAGHTDSVYDIAFHPANPTVFATASRDRTAVIWNLSSALPTPRLTLRGHEGPIYRLAFDPKHARIATASFDRSTVLWDVTTGARLHSFCKHEDELRAVAFSPDGQRLATAAADGKAHLYGLTGIEGKPDFDCAGATIVRHKKNEQSTVQVLAVAVHPEPGRAEWVTAGSDGRLQLWDFGGQRLGSILSAPEDPRASADVRDVTFANGGNTVVALVGSSVLFWPSSSFRAASAKWERRVTVPAKGGCGSLTFDPREEQFAVSCDDGAIYIYDAATLTPVKEIRVHDYEATSVSFSSDGKWLATASKDGTFHVSPLNVEQLYELARGTAKRVGLP